LPKDAVCAEVGVFRGEFSRQILEITGPRELHLIDGWWELYGECFPAFWGEYTLHGKLTTRQAYEDALERTEPYRDITTIHVGNDMEILERFPDAYFDWVYLDSGHVYEDTLLELALLERKVKPTGIICGDDFTEDPSDLNHGCALAILEFCERGPWRLAERDRCHQWRLERR
jgi:hypothetical protein